MQLSDGGDAEHNEGRPSGRKYWTKKAGFWPAHVPFESTYIHNKCSKPDLGKCLLALLTWKASILVSLAYVD
jgi:hypothetical protein